MRGCPSLCEFSRQGLPACRSASECRERLSRFSEDVNRSPLRPTHQRRVEEAHALIVTMTSLAIPLRQACECRNAFVDIAFQSHIEDLPSCRADIPKHRRLR